MCKILLHGADRMQQVEAATNGATAWSGTMMQHMVHLVEACRGVPKRHRAASRCARVSIQTIYGDAPERRPRHADVQWPSLYFVLEWRGDNLINHAMQLTRRPATCRKSNRTSQAFKPVSMGVSHELYVH